MKQKAPASSNLQEVAREMARKRKLAVASLLESKRAAQEELAQIDQALRKLNYRDAEKPSQN